MYHRIRPLDLPVSAVFAIWEIYSERELRDTREREGERERGAAVAL